MIQDYPETDLFKKQMGEALQREGRNSRAIKIAKHENVYLCGAQDEMVYFIESGQVKLLVLSFEGRSVDLLLGKRWLA
jgi:CRP-like cAMP-binding protein